MADFSDEFSEASATLLRDHTPNTGTSWDETRDTGTTGTHAVAQIDNVNNSAEPSAADHSQTHTQGYLLINPQITNADKQVWAQLGNDRSFGNSFVAVRLQDKTNAVGFRQGGGGAQGSRLAKIVAGTVTDLVNFGTSTEDWIRVKAEGSTVTVYSAAGPTEPASPEEDTNWTEEGSSTVSDFETEADCGLVVATIISDNWMNAFRASSLGGAAGGLIYPHKLSTAQMKHFLGR